VVDGDVAVIDAWIVADVELFEPFAAVAVLGIVVAVAATRFPFAQASFVVAVELEVVVCEE